MRRAVLLLALLGGCTPSGRFPYVDLVDQRSFWPKVEQPDASRVRDLPKLPLAVIRFDAGATAFQAPLAQAVDAAIARKPDVEFSVVTAIAPGAVPDTTAARQATDVAHAIAEQSVPVERIHLGTIEDANAAPREVRVYVR